MYDTVLLLLTGPLRTVVESLGRYFKSARRSVSRQLYVKLEPDLLNPMCKSDRLNLSRLSSTLKDVYSKAPTDIDVRLVLSNYRSLIGASDFQLDAVVTNSKSDESTLSAYLQDCFRSSCSSVVRVQQEADQEDEQGDEDFQVFGTICLGGTFDRLHNGHKVLLSAAIIRATNKLIVGVSEGAMIQRKVLWELIEPVHKRMEEVTKFLTAVDPTLQYEVVPIVDPYGPTITEPNIDCLLVTTETKVGGEKVNIERKKKDMKEVSLYVIDLVENAEHSSEEDEKMSSSTIRMHLLGTLLKPSEIVLESGMMRCILVRGQPPVDKSFVTSRFQRRGVPVLCCDQILDTILNKDKNFKNNFSETFRDTVFTDNGILSLPKLKAACLLDQEKSRWLAEKYCHIMVTILHQVLDVYSQHQTRLMIIKDSTLFEGHDLNMDFEETWVVILPVPDAIKKLEQEYGCSEKDAMQIRSHLPSNTEYVQMANRVFCNMWSENTVDQQVERAMISLRQSC